MCSYHKYIIVYEILLSSHWRIHRMRRRYSFANYLENVASHYIKSVRRGTIPKRRTADAFNEEFLLPTSRKTGKKVAKEKSDDVRRLHARWRSLSSSYISQLYFWDAFGKGVCAHTRWPEVPLLAALSLLLLRGAAWCILSTLLERCQCCDTFADEPEGKYG